MNFAKKHLDYYNKIVDQNTELELKIIVDPRINKPIFVKSPHLSIPDIYVVINQMILDIPEKPNATSKSDNNEQSINFIKNLQENNCMIIKQLVFENNIQIQDKKNIYIKKQLSKPVYITNTKYPVKICINSEIQQSIIEKGKIDNNTIYDIIRIRNRFTYNINSNWRLDITFIKETKNNDFNHIKLIKDKLFLITKFDIEKFDINYADRIEVELEFIGDKSQIINIDTILQLIKQFNIYYKSDDKYYKNIIKIAELSANKNLQKFIDNEYGLKQISPNPIELTKKKYNTDIFTNIGNYIVTEKIDGLRHILMLYPYRGECYILNSLGQTTIEINKEDYLITSNISQTQQNRPDDVIIIDAELCNTSENSIKNTNDSSDNIFYIFDVIWYYDKNVASLVFTDRLEYIKLISNKYEFIKLKKFISLEKTNFKDELTNIHQLINSENSIPNDGLIFIQKNETYLNTLCYKWKPIEKTTIDFVAKICPPYLLGIAPYNVVEGKLLYLLFSGNKSTEYKKLGIIKIKKYDILFNYVKYNDSYFPIQFSPSSNTYAYLFWSDNYELDNKIVELCRSNNEWNLIKIREDRKNDLKLKSYYGNYFKYAELIWMNYTNSITLNDLVNPNFGYFKIHNNAEFNYLRKYNNFVKSKLYKLYESENVFNWVIDLAAGKGQDLFKYIDNNAKNVLFIDNDKNSLEEIINRKYSYIKNTKYTQSCNIFINELNLTDSYKLNLTKLYNDLPHIPKNGVPLLICNFAIHYIIATKKNLLNFVNLVNSLLCSSGIFIMTAFNPKKIRELLKNGSWSSPPYNISKYRNSDDTIELILPFTTTEKYKEKLIDIESFNAAMEKHKINLVCSDSFISFMSLFGEVEKLKENDKQFISLYNYYIYKKV